MAVDIQKGDIVEWRHRAPSQRGIVVGFFGSVEGLYFRVRVGGNVEKALGKDLEKVPAEKIPNVGDVVAKLGKGLEVFGKVTSYFKDSDYPYTLTDVNGVQLRWDFNLFKMEERHLRGKVLPDFKLIVKTPEPKFKVGDDIQIIATGRKGQVYEYLPDKSFPYRCRFYDGGQSNLQEDELALVSRVLEVVVPEDLLSVRSLIKEKEAELDALRTVEKMLVDA